MTHTPIIPALDLPVAIAHGPKRVLVSGVTGQDGSYMVDYLLTNTDHLVYGMVRRTAKPDYGNLAAALANPRFKLVTGDLTDAQSIEELVAEIKPDYFINFGAQAFVGVSWKLKDLTEHTNSDGVRYCLEAIRKHVPQCHFYNAGTSEEFGEVEYSPQDEKHPPRPQSPYGASKVAARQHVRVFRESYGLYAVQGWLFNHESKRRGQDYVTRKITLGVARIAAAIKAGQPFEPIELGNLDAKRDWSHAEDFVEGIWRMVNQEDHREAMRGVLPQHLSRCLEEYVLASGETHTIREFVEKAFAAAGIIALQTAQGSQGNQQVQMRWHGTGADEIYELGGMVTCVSDSGWDSSWGYWKPLVRINPAFYRPAEVHTLHGDASRARTELGWQPRHTFDDLVAEMVAHDLKEAGL